jgi:hypothetical protein
MTMNAPRNAAWLAYLFALVFAFGLLWFILPQITDGIYLAVNHAQANAINDKAYLDYLTLKTLLIQGFYTLASVIVFFTFVSSIFDSQTLQGYIYSAIAGLIITPTVIYITASFWNTFVVMGITFNDVSLTFINSFGQIMLVNFLAGLLSFIYMRKGWRPSMSG